MKKSLPILILVFCACFSSVPANALTEKQKIAAELIAGGVLTGGGIAGLLTADNWGSRLERIIQMALIFGSEGFRGLSRREVFAGLPELQREEYVQYALSRNKRLTRESFIDILPSDGGHTFMAASFGLIGVKICKALSVAGIFCGGGLICDGLRRLYLLMKKKEEKADDEDSGK